jgi:hypothetical protein
MTDIQLRSFPKLSGVHKGAYAMKKIIVVTLASLVALSAAACATVGKGKGKAPAPAPAPIVSRAG